MDNLSPTAQRAIVPPSAPAGKYLKALITHDNMKYINFVPAAYKAQAHCLSGFAPCHSHCAES